MSFIPNMQLLIGTLLVTQFLSCAISGQSTRVKLEGENPPLFVLSGSGKLSDLIIFGPKQRDISGDRAFALWEIKPTDGRKASEPLETIGKIKYGVVPKNYVQIYPENGVSPPSLLEGERYEYWVQTLNAPHARSYFEIRDGKAVEVSR